MATKLTGYWVYFASPAPMPAEVESFRRMLNWFNEAHAVRNGAIFLPTEWSVGAQGLVQPGEQERSRDYGVVLLHDRWDAPVPDAPYAADIDELLRTAFEHKEGAGRMKGDVAIFFAALDPNDAADPGPQLAKVIGFKKKLEEDPEFPFENYEDERSFERKLQPHLNRWLDRHVRRRRPGPKGLAEIGEPRAAYDELDVHVDTSLPDGEPESAEARILREVRDLVAAGRRTEAETILGREVAAGAGVRVLLEYARHLRSSGLPARAMHAAADALHRASADGDRAAEADAHFEVGSTYYDEEDVVRAEASYRMALGLYLEIDNEEGVADCKRQIGLLLVRRGEWGEAKMMYEQARTIDERLGRNAAVADDYSALGSLYFLANDLQGAEEMHQVAYEIDKRLGRLDHVAKHCSDLGTVRHRLGDLAGAEKNFREALDLDRQRGNRESMADDYANLGGVLDARGQFNAAVGMHREAAGIDELLGRFDTLAEHYDNIAAIEERRGRTASAELARERARAARQRQAGAEPDAPNSQSAADGLP